METGVYHPRRRGEGTRGGAVATQDYPSQDQVNLREIVEIHRRLYGTGLDAGLRCVDARCQRGLLVSHQRTEENRISLFLKQ